MTDLSTLESSGVSTAADPNSPLMVAWEQFKRSDSFANSRKWAEHDQHRDGSMWNCFMVGWMAATASERERAVAVVNAARNEEIDTDLRSIRSAIGSGYIPKEIETRQKEAAQK